MRGALTLAMLMIVLAGCRGAAAADEVDVMQRIGAWFKLEDRTLEEWAYSMPDPADELRVRLSRKAAAAGPLHRIMVIYPRKSSAYDVAMSTLLDDVAARGLNAELTAVSFANDAARGDRLVAEAEREGYDLVYAMGSETVAFLHGAHRDIAVPVVTICAKDPVQLGQMPDYTSGSGTSFAFTSLNVLLEVQLEYLRELKPGLRTIAILVDATNTSAVETQAKPIAAAAAAAGIEAFDVAVTEPERAREQLARLVPEAVRTMRQSDPLLENSIFWVTGSTSVFVEIETINAHAATAPVLAVVPEVVQAGPNSAVLSIGVSFTSNAQLASVYGAEILSGRVRPGELPVGVVSPPDIAINFLRARAIGLRIPFSFLEAASFVYDGAGRLVRERGRDIPRIEDAALAPVYSPVGGRAVASTR